MAGCTLTVRLIRSFEHRNVKHLVYTNVDLSQKLEDFILFVTDDITKRPGLPPPFRKFKYDTMKIQHKAHGAKTSDPVINTEDDEHLMLQPGKSLAEGGVEPETEISFFRLEDYLAYKKNPHVVW